jgi:acetyl esterase
VEYRLAPEHPYPAPVEDAVAALLAVAVDPAGFGADAGRLGIGGNSAGAAIAASTALRLRRTGAVRLVHQDLEVLPAALHPVGASSVDFARGFGLDDFDAIARLYVGPDGPSDGDASPVDVADLDGLPPTLIMAAEWDPLRDSAVLYADRLAKAGVPVVLHIGRGHLHGSPALTARMPGALEWQRLHAAELGRAYDSPPCRRHGNPDPPPVTIGP